MIIRERNKVTKQLDCPPKKIDIKGKAKGQELCLFFQNPGLKKPYRDNVYKNLKFRYICKAKNKR